MLKVYEAEIDEFLRWTSSRAANGINKTRASFPMSGKVYRDDRITCARFAQTRNMLSSFTTIVPGKGKDDYWDNEDMCAHLVEAADLALWVHRKPHPEQQPDIYFIFDGSSNHGARASDALHVGAGINRDAGGKNAPGARASDTKPEVPKMCEGWYTDKVTLLTVKQVCVCFVWFLVQEAMFLPLFHIVSWVAYYTGNAQESYVVGVGARLEDKLHKC
jgi:hypothetical protein